MEAGTIICKKCKSEMHIKPLSSVTGEEGGVKVTFRNLPALACTQDHRRFVRPDFPAQLLDRLATEVKVPAGEIRGMVFKSYHCGSCGEKLAGAAPAPKTFEFDLSLKGVEPFGVALTVPVYACPSCRKEQVRSLAEVIERTPAAMARAFQAAGIPPG
jgi:ribosomal protein L37AE/L43A